MSPHTMENNSPRLAFGTDAIMGSGDESFRQQLLETALENGITHFDTARYYGLGQAEAVIGRFAKGKRERITITTKLGIVPNTIPEEMLSRLVGKTLGKIPPLAGPIKSSIERGKQARRHRFSETDIRKSIEASLTQLRTDYVDILLAHAPVESDITDEVVGLMTRLKVEGKAKEIGLGGLPEDILGIAAAKPKIADVCQFKCNVLNSASIVFPRSAKKIITYGAIGDALGQILNIAQTNPALLSRFKFNAEVDLKDRTVLADLMLLHSLLINNAGLQIFKTRRTEMITHNCKITRGSQYPEGVIREFGDWAGSLGLNDSKNSAQ
jgi:D-threo-aldose 1-dehydrogenase